MSQWAKYRHGNSPDGGLPIANLTEDSESESLGSYSDFLVGITIASRLVSEIFACDTQTDRGTDRQTYNNVYCYKSCPHIVAG